MYTLASMDGMLSACIKSTVCMFYILQVMNYSLMIIEELFTATSSIVGDVSSMLSVSSKTCKD